MRVDGGDQQRLRRVQAGHHLQRSPVPELGDPVQGGPEGRGGGGGFRAAGPFQQFLEYAEEWRAFVPEPDVVPAQQVMPEHEGEHAGLVPREVKIPPAEGQQRRPRVGVALADRLGDQAAEVAVALPGDGREQRRMGGEVAARGAVRDPGPAGDLPQREGIGAGLGQQCDAGRHEACFEIPALHRQCLPAVRRHCLPGQPTGGAQPGRGIRQKGWPAGSA